MREYGQVYIDGRWVEPDAGRALPVTDSFTEEVIATVPAGGPSDVDAAVVAARQAFPTWSALSPGDRATFLNRIHDGLEARADEIARTITREVGMPLRLSSVLQTAMPIANFAIAAKLATDHSFEERIGNSLIVRDAVGVVGCITPWNYPLHQIALKVAPALAAGNTVVLKPSEVAPINAFILAEVVHDVGLPAGVFNLVTGVGEIVGEAIAAHPDVDMVSFTGSTRAGRRVAELASQTVKRVALELGGKSANLILDDADFDKAVADGVGKCFINSGQTCTALTRMLVPRERLAEVELTAVATAATFTPGDPFDKASRLGPLVSSAQRDRVRGLIQKGIDEGATLLTGGTDVPEGLDRGFFVSPTVFSNVTRDMTIAREEIFGPVLSIIPYDSEDEAIDIANDTVYGLAAGVTSSDPERAMRVARRIRAGRVEVNGGRYNPLAPFGGYKQSGLGREGGRFGLEEFMEVKALQQ